MNKHYLYLKAFHNSVKQYAEEAPDFENRKEHIKKSVYYGVKTIINIEDYKENLESNFQFISIVKDLIGTLTPGEFENLFPISKEYDGHKYQTKDYFYTKDYLNTLDPDKPINKSDDPLHFLMEYQNKDITGLNIASMMIMSNLRQSQGYPSLGEEWADKEGIAPSPNIHRNNKDERFIIRSGKIEMLDNPKQSHLRLIK